MAAAYAPPSTMSALKEYVSGSSTMQQSAESTVQLFISHNHLKARFPEIRLDKHVRILLDRGPTQHAAVAAHLDPACSSGSGTGGSIITLGCTHAAQAYLHKQNATYPRLYKHNLANTLQICELTSIMDCRGLYTSIASAAQR
eukprot:GHRQ01031858.1.p1 GENE.GHRQ01031858.1~~GHRQ01031858.1.p1  ORF type:complete len:143 (+),score=12.37 GHRQ01031858.1:215-643(+)